MSNNEQRQRNRNQRRQIIRVSEEPASCKPSRHRRGIACLRGEMEKCRTDGTKHCDHHSTLHKTERRLGCTDTRHEDKHHTERQEAGKIDLRQPLTTLSKSRRDEKPSEQNHKEEGLDPAMYPHRSFVIRYCPQQPVEDHSGNRDASEQPGRQPKDRLQSRHLPRPYQEQHDEKSD
jgi:hypothetical protein